MAYPDLRTGGKPALGTGWHVLALLSLAPPSVARDLPLPSSSSWQRPVKHPEFLYM